MSSPINEGISSNLERKPNYHPFSFRSDLGESELDLILKDLSDIEYYLRIKLERLEANEIAVKCGVPLDKLISTTHIPPQKVPVMILRRHNIFDHPKETLSRNSASLSELEQLEKLFSNKS